MHVSFWLLRRGTAPRADVPGVQQLHLFGRLLVGAAWVVYTDDGVLAYDELMCTVLVRQGWRIIPSITHIWVDSVASRDGGRALWGIPKQLAEFTVDGPRFAAGGLAATTVRPGPALPGWWPVRFAVVQELAGRALRSPVRATGRWRLARAAWHPDPVGPLAFLRGRPLITVSIEEFRMRFGRS